MRQCQAQSGASLDPTGQRQCHRKATKLAIDDDGDTFYFCGNCARMFEGGMQTVRDLPVRKKRRSTHPTPADSENVERKKGA